MHFSSKAVAKIHKDAFIARNISLFPSLALIHLIIRAMASRRALPGHCAS